MAFRVLRKANCHGNRSYTGRRSADRSLFAMTIAQQDILDPTAIDLDKVKPQSGLGSSFEFAAYPTLLFSTKSRIFGDKHPNAIEPTEPGYASNGLRQVTLLKDRHRCMFCGFYSPQNEIHNLTDNHCDIRPENLRAADPLCHGWQHLGELGDGNAVIAYLPGLTGQDVNHLQRTIMVALQSGDATVREDARKLMNWMASHRDYTKSAWGTHDPSVFASALIRLKEQDREKREVVFQYLAVVFNPGLYGQYASMWARESYGTLPVNKWRQVYHDVMHAPA